MQRKLVRVVATGRIQLAFLPVIGINTVPIAAEAISETASVDVVLVIDRSESMTDSILRIRELRNETQVYCNTCRQSRLIQVTRDYCRPFFDVKKAAVSFVNQLYFPYDRVSVITFDKDATRVLELFQ